jgi:hypothetical protein
MVASLEKEVMKMKIASRGYSATALPFEGTPEEAQKNWETHNFTEESRCMFCDCRPWGAWAQYPCEGADKIKVARYELPNGTSVWVKTVVKGGQEYFVGLYDSEPWEE